MWILFAFGSAFFAGITAVLAKCGIKDVDSDAATAVRTVVVLVFSWVMVFVSGSEIGPISGKNMDVFDSLRSCNRSILAVLFQSSSARRRK